MDISANRVDMDVEPTLHVKTHQVNFKVNKHARLGSDSSTIIHRSGILSQVNRRMNVYSRRQDFKNKLSEL